MQLTLQRRIAASVLKCSQKRVTFDNSRLEDIKEAITKVDVRGLISDGAVKKIQKKGVSRARARKIAEQKSKGRRKGKGSRKGSKYARCTKKERWMKTIRAQRDLLKTLRDKKIIMAAQYHELYGKSKGGFFRSRRHIKLYLEEHGMTKK